MKSTKIKRFLQVIAANLVVCFILPLSLSVTAYASTVNGQKQNITFYIDNQIVNSDKATIRLVHGYADHPSLKNLYAGNNKITIPEGTYTLSVIVNDGYIFDFSHGVVPDIMLKNAKRSPIRAFNQYTLLAMHTYISSTYQNQTLVLLGKIIKDNRDKTNEERFYLYHPEYKGKEFSYEFDRTDINGCYSYLITKNGESLAPDDKLKVGDKVRVTQHYYDQDSIRTDVFLNDVPFVYNNSGELYADYTITTDDILVEFDKPAEDSVIRLTAGAGSCTTVFTDWKDEVNITTNCEAGGSFNMYLATLDKNNKESLTKLNSNMRIVPGNRFKLEPIPVTGWQFDRWNVEGGIVTANNYFIVTDDTVNITAVFTKKHDIASGSTSSVYGDVDNDGEISFSDVEELITLFLNDASYSQRYDLDKSGSFDFDDVSTMITIFLNSLG